MENIVGFKKGEIMIKDLYDYLAKQINYSGHV